MSLSKAKHQHTDRTIKEKIEILGKLFWCKSCRFMQTIQFESIYTVYMEETEMQTQRDGRCWESSPHKMQS